LAVMVAAFLFSLRRDGVFACPPSKYIGDYYLAYCHGKAYGDYDHGAFWFGLEPTARHAAASADVLFIGNSRMQFGFSAPALGHWFDAIGHRYYLLGFSHVENVTFFRPLLRNLHAQPRAYVINLDRFFDDEESLPGHDVMYGTDTRARYVAKRNWQLPHRLICAWQLALCGDQISFYRRRETGEWRVDGSLGLVPSDMGPELPVDSVRVRQEQVNAERFISSLGVNRRCVFLTYVPWQKNETATAAALALALGFDLVSPKLEHLRTFDGSHLDRESAERFVTAFLEIGGSRLRQCLDAEAPFPRANVAGERSPVGVAQ